MTPVTLHYAVVGTAVAATGFFGWLALRALVTGHVRFFWRAGRGDYFSRRSNAGSYLVVLSWYIALGLAALATAYTALSRH